MDYRGDIVVVTDDKYAGQMGHPEWSAVIRCNRTVDWERNDIFIMSGICTPLELPLGHWCSTHERHGMMGQTDRRTGNDQSLAYCGRMADDRRIINYITRVHFIGVLECLIASLLKKKVGVTGWDHRHNTLYKADHRTNYSIFTYNAGRWKWWRYTCNV